MLIRDIPIPCKLCGRGTRRVYHAASGPNGDHGRGRGGPARGEIDRGRGDGDAGIGRSGHSNNGNGGGGGGGSTVMASADVGAGNVARGREGTGVTNGSSTEESGNVRGSCVDGEERWVQGYGFGFR